ncbi:unnamed protein product [Prorocentrum cordatum]|uniref:Uncharacterized protein n=1 Tax=Prorocentrum cordatum TaxID=2364126 RepID=A0ABN9UB24_9DINO|nr:unnamed protein product [Polarella glacialis]
MLGPSATRTPTAWSATRRWPTSSWRERARHQGQLHGQHVRQVPRALHARRGRLGRLPRRPPGHRGQPSSDAERRGALQLLGVLRGHGRGLLAARGLPRQPAPPRHVGQQGPECVDTVLANWRETAATVTGKGYKYLTTPLIADDNLEYAEKFIDAACGCSGDPQGCECTEAACGCPAFVGFHFYAFDCQPEESGGYRKFQAKLDYVARLMDQYDFLKGAIINEVGMLNCAAPSDEMPICVENSGRFPASAQEDHACPDDGLADYITRLFQLVANATAKDGRGVVKGFSWFNMNMAGGTYNLQLFNKDGTVNAAGNAYMQSCERWGEQQKKR